MKDLRDVEPTVNRYLTQIAIELGMDLVDMQFHWRPDASGGPRTRLVVGCAYAPIEAVTCSKS